MHIIASLLLFLLFGLLFLVIIAAVLLRTVARRMGLDSIIGMLRGNRDAAHSHASQRQQAHQKQATTPHGDVIIDRRDPEKASQKIFRKDEGEYVDYKEEP